MAEFSYIARDREGARVEGKVNAPDQRAALAQVERLGLMPVSLGEAGGATGNGKAAKAEPTPKKGAPAPRGARSRQARCLACTMAAGIDAASKAASMPKPFPKSRRSYSSTAKVLARRGGRGLVSQASAARRGHSWRVYESAGRGPHAPRG